MEPAEHRLVVRVRGLSRRSSEEAGGKRHVTVAMRHRPRTGIADMIVDMMIVGRLAIVGMTNADTTESVGKREIADTKKETVGKMIVSMMEIAGMLGSSCKSDA